MNIKYLQTDCSAIDYLKSVFGQTVLDNELYIYENHNRLEYCDMAVHLYRDYLELRKEREFPKSKDFQKGATVIRQYIREYKRQLIHFGFFYLDFVGFDLVIKPCKAPKRTANLPEEWQLSKEEMAQLLKDYDYYAHPERWSKGQWNMVCLWDYIIANQIEQAIHKEMGIQDEPPLFLVDAFDDMDNADAKGYLDALRAMDRQVFIIQRHENAYVRKYCDQAFEV